MILLNVSFSNMSSQKTLCVASALQVYERARAHNAALATSLMEDARRKDARRKDAMDAMAAVAAMNAMDAMDAMDATVKPLAVDPDQALAAARTEALAEEAASAAKKAEKAAKAAALAAAKAASTPFPLEVTLEWAGSGDAIGKCWIDFDSCANVSEPKNDEPLMQLQGLSTTQLTMRTRCLQQQVQQAIACLQPGSQPEFANTLRLFVGHGGVEITPDPVFSKSRSNFEASPEAKAQYRALLKLQRENKGDVQANKKPLVLSVALYEDHARLVWLIENSDTRQAGVNVFPAFLSACRQYQTTTYKGFGLTFDSVTSLPVMTALCNKWPAHFVDLIPHAYLDDMRFMTLCTSRLVFSRASPRLLNDNAFIRLAFSFKNWSCQLLHLLSPAMQDDEHIVRWAIWSGGPKELQFASDRIKSDRELVEFACSIDPLALCYASPELKCDPHLLNACFAVVPAARFVEFRKSIDPAWLDKQKLLLKFRKPKVKL